MIEASYSKKYPEIPLHADFATNSLKNLSEGYRGIPVEVWKAIPLTDWRTIQCFLCDIVKDARKYVGNTEWEFSNIQYNFWEKESYCEECAKVAVEFSQVIKYRESEDYLRIVLIPETFEHKEEISIKLKELDLSVIAVIDPEQY